VRNDLAKPGTALDIEIFGERRPAKVGTEPLYDPSNARLRM
jgi:dimethylglycine dehydrogenase